MCWLGFPVPNRISKEEWARAMINELRAASEDVGGGGTSLHPHPHWFMSTMSFTPSIRTAIGQASRRSGAASTEVQSAYGMGRGWREVRDADFIVQAQLILLQ